MTQGSCVEDLGSGEFMVGVGRGVGNDQVALLVEDDQFAVGDHEGAVLGEAWFRPDDGTVAEIAAHELSGPSFADAVDVTFVDHGAVHLCFQILVQPDLARFLLTELEQGAASAFAHRSPWK